MKKILPTNLLQGYKNRKSILVDDNDFEWLNSYKWHLRKGSGKNIYAYASVEGKQVAMHRLIMGVSREMEVDHINRKSLDNRRENLKICTKQENALNKGFKRTKNQPYKGVFFSPRIKKWKVKITLGFFENPEHASSVYKEILSKYDPYRSKKAPSQ